MFYVVNFWCFTLHLMKSAQHCLYNSGIKVDILDTWGAMICLYFGIAFLQFFIRIENAVYTFCSLMDWFVTTWTLQNNQSFEFEWKPVSASLRSVNDWRFSWLHNVFLKLFQVGWILFRNTKETLKEMLVRKYSSWGGKHEGLKISINWIIETTQFLLWHQVKYDRTLLSRSSQKLFG